MVTALEAALDASPERVVPEVHLVGDSVVEVSGLGVHTLHIALSGRCELDAEGCRIKLSRRHKTLTVHLSLRVVSNL